MTEYLRSEKARRDAILNDTPDTKFYFESQKFSDIPDDRRPNVNNRFQWNEWGAQEVRRLAPEIEAAAARHSVDSDVVKAIIFTEASRGRYGRIPELIYDYRLLPLPELAKTRLPANLSAVWQKLIPGSDVHNEKDNIEIATKLISRIAKRLDDPSIEDIYSLYNSLSHDRTYVNKETKSTPYFAKLAMEAKAWEKDDWKAPELPSAKAAQDQKPWPSDRVGNWASSPAGIPSTSMSDGPDSFDDRFGSWGSVPWLGSGNPSPVIRELLKYRRSMAPDTSGGSTAARDLVTPASALRPNAASGDTGEPATADALPVRYLSSRIAGKSNAPFIDADAAAAPLVPSDEIFFPGRPASFDDRVGSQITPLPAGAPGGSYQLEPPRPAARLPGLVSGKPMDHLLPPSIFGLPEAPAAGDEDWLMQLLAPRGRR